MNGHSAPVIIVPSGTHMLSLLEYNSRDVVAALDYRMNGSLQKAGLLSLTNTVYEIGTESTLPIYSWWYNWRYYQRLKKRLNDLLIRYPDARFIITVNYTPFTRCVIDCVGAHRVELWEDGLNHYIHLESLLKNYRVKELTKLLLGFYRKGLFETRYRQSEMTVLDRFKRCNLHYPIAELTTGKRYYIGQPLIEDGLLREANYRSRLTGFFAGKGEVIYLPHPREKERIWLHDIFTVERPTMSAEKYLLAQGASAVYSAFSTVNVNVQCNENVFLARHLGLLSIAERLQGLDFEVEMR